MTDFVKKSQICIFVVILHGHNDLQIALSYIYILNFSFIIHQALKIKIRKENTK